MKSLYERVEQFIEESFKDKSTNIAHLQRTAYWAQKIKPDSDAAFLIASLSHDIERAQRSANAEPSNFLDPIFLRYHQEEGARIMGEFLSKQGAGSQLIERVKMLIAYHEVGGNTEQNFLRDIDSLSFFENNAEHFVEIKAKEVGKKAVKNKLDWMFNRIDDLEIRRKTKPLYEKWIEKLQK